MGETPKVGLGVVIVRDGKILVGKRQGAHAQFYSIPGGHVEVGETFEEAAIREIKEETNINIKNPQVIAITNNMNTYKNEGKHYVSIILLVEDSMGEPLLMEPERCENWQWCDPNNLPMPHFDASQRGVECYLEKVHYKKYE